MKTTTGQRRYYERHRRAGLWRRAAKALLTVSVQAALLTTVMLTSAVQTALAQESYGTEGDWEYTYAAGVATLTEYKGTATVVTTPTTLGGNAVRIIGNNCFCGNASLTSVKVSEGVVQIYSFMDCTQLESISLPSTLSKLGEYAFYNCSSLKAIALPSGMTHINEYTFAGCSSLETVSIPSSVRVIDKDAFAECHALTSVTLPAGVTEIEEQTFLNCRDLATVKILGNVIRIGTAAFSGCSNALTSITIPGSVSKIGEGAFRLCSILANVYFDGSKAQWNAVTKGDDWNSDVPSDFKVHWRCKLTYDMQGHGTAPAAQTVYSGTANVLTAPTEPMAQGYYFGGWYANAACTGTTFDFSTALDDNTTLYAKWTPRQNIIIFDLGGKGTAISNQTVTTGDVVTEPDVQFDGEEGIEGWYTDIGLTQKYDFTAAVDNSMRLYAKWAAAGTATISVTNGEGSTVTLTDGRGQTFNNGKVMPGVYTLTVTPQSGYSFTGSYTLTDRSSGASLQPTSISGGTARTYTLDLTENDVAVSVTFSTQPILTVTTRADEAGVQEGVTWSVVNNQTPAAIKDGGAIPFISDPNGAVASDFGIRLNVDLGWLRGFAFTATITDNGNGSTTYKNSIDGTSFLIQPYGSIDIDLYVYRPQAITLADDGSNIAAIAALHGNVADMKLKRAFTAGKKQTVCLPFAPEALLSLGTVWEFTGISDGKVVMTQRTSGLKANTPYIFEPNDDIDAKTGIAMGDVSINYGSDPKTKKTSAGFTFHGTYEQKTWEADDAAVTNGTIYGFMAQDNDGQQTGQFVRARRKTILRPFSCYLEYTGEGDLTGTKNAAPRRMTRGEGEPLPDAIDIVWLPASGSTTGIGATQAAPACSDQSWYTIDGRRLTGRPAQKGLYIHNGRKEVLR